MTVLLCYNPRQANPASVLLLFHWASTLLLRFERLALSERSKGVLSSETWKPRILFGADTVQKKMESAKFHMDSWFTGADFPHVALEQISVAVRLRRSDVHKNLPLL